MKAIVSALLVSCALAAPFSAFAQSTGNNDASLSRAQVQADLVRVEQAGYQPSGSQANYPANLERAEAIVAKQDGSASLINTSGTVAMTGVSTGNQPVSHASRQSVYFGD
ncbi:MULTISPECIES: DUF4148 domain-containing protein [Pandoraea]|uniref:Purine nucleoside phosphorylase n=1 Tax=Pandoraea communis TaxID=2508297 RepID=A0A5E4RWH3_9BURK|nr:MULTISPECIES: DUF4148 domain-containing protein [Pandoraea]EON14546.1 hypothetical protein C266_05499 [Pandoraea sp. SD6-2]VVD67181.1 hypothetical protein PCO31110_00411 [Pandoraea communis]